MASFLWFSGYAISSLIVFVFVNVLRQFLPRRKSEPPLVFNCVPFVGNAVAYGQNPHRFLEDCRRKHGDIFTFVLFGRKMTCYLGCSGNDFILNAKHSDCNAEDIYGPLTIPMFGTDVVYDCPNEKLMEQKRFIKFGLSQEALKEHVSLIEREVLDYIKTTQSLKGRLGQLNVTPSMAELTIFTAARALQGAEVRSKLDRGMARLYHDLDLGFQPINFLLPWAPLPHNRRRDIAHVKIRKIFTDIIAERRKVELEGGEVEHDMIWNLMHSTYKNGTPVPDKEIAHIMITLLMGGQHSSSAASSWTLLELAARPDIQEELYQEQVRNLSESGNGYLRPLQYSDLDKMPLLQGVIKETLRVHPSILAILRKVTKPMPVPGTPYVVGTDKVLLASPSITAMSEEYFPDAKKWKPHRWLSRSDNDEQDTEIVDYGYGPINKGTKSPFIPFGAGRHRCIGEKASYVNLSVIIATLVRHFRFSTVDGSSIVPETDYTSMFATPKWPAIIRWERREEAAV
ncbi:cytochrome P450 51A [Westerdykella ornata]|uniref:Cytochrome P450 51A n=1 Tax=Westerdykella ornata TaxID=318751 RepID=A0A6A6JZH2_WESOR|nr:cytochrome P450 51A [Westerdykella ornata]KAF2280459.1 cytochrome P450 51A [Westerdykella ornata]